MPAPRTGKPRRTRFPAAVDLPLSSFHSPTTGKKNGITEFLRSAIPFVSRFMVEAGRVELPSEKIPRKASTGLGRH